jgi:uncharacterized protein YoxC
MKISPFLAVVTFCCLLFMEEDTDLEKAYNKLGLDLGELDKSLKKLRNTIRVQTTTTKDIDDRIDTIIGEVNSAKKTLKYKGEPAIRKNISIAQPLKEVEESIARFSSLTKSSSDELNVLVSRIEKTWREQIQKTFLEAMK